MQPAILPKTWLLPVWPSSASGALAYAHRPLLRAVSVNVNTYGTGTKSALNGRNWLAKFLTQARLPFIQALHLRKPIFRNTAAYGHLVDPNFPGEQTRLRIHPQGPFCNPTLSVPDYLNLKKPGPRSRAFLCSKKNKQQVKHHRRIWVQLILKKWR